MALLSSVFIRRSILIQLFALVPALLFCQITIRERVEIKSTPAKRSTVAGTLDTLPTLRFEYKTCCLGYPTTLIANTPVGTLTAQGTGGVVLTVPNAPGGTYFLTLMEEVGWLSNVWLEARERILLDTTLVRSGTYLTHGGPGYVYWNLPSCQTPVKIKITLASSELTPLGDSDNKPNPNPSDTKRPKIIDYSRAKSTPMSAVVSYHDGNPARNYQLTFRAFGKDTTGGHIHDLHMRPGGRFVTARQETTYMLQVRTDTTGKVQCRYLCSGVGGIDSIYVRGASPIDTATALVSVKVQGMMELTAGAHYKLIGWTPRHPSNHFGTKKTIDKLKMLADSAYAHSSWILRYNDISLINGGPFDCDSTHRWDTPHQNHREGVSVDLDDQAETEGGKKAITRKRLGEWLKMIQGEDKLSFGDEGNHFHITVK